MVAMLMLLLSWVGSNKGSSIMATADMEALVAIKQAFVDKQGALNAWNTSGGEAATRAQACGWVGIKCAEGGHVIILQLSNKGLSGVISPKIGQLVALRKLNLHTNAITGTIPATLAALPNLRALYLFRNNLSGTIPSPLSTSLVLQTLDISHNRLSGPFPASLSSSLRLLRIDLSFNNLSSSMPPTSLSSFPSLSFLDLSHNLLYGSLPSSLATLPNLTRFNCSFNRLSGPVPKFAHFFNSSSFDHNLGLCGFSPSSPCASSPSPAVGFSSARSEVKKKKKFSAMTLVFIVVGVVIVSFLFLCLLFLLCICCCRKMEIGKDGFPGDKSEQPSKESGEFSGKLVHFEGSLGFAADDLLCATAEVLGKSTYGTVYKATLEDGNQVAVKRLREGIVKSQRDFEVEVATLGRIRHANLLAMRAFYWGPKGEKLLVYDFMQGGSLAAFLHARGPDTPLNWQTRMNIAVGVARGLAYLHDHEQIIHGNLTCSNILLDAHLNPKLSDFGLSRLMTAAANSNVIATAGALGYRAPELTKLRRANPKSDVYSFGTVLLELMTGKAPSEGSSAEGGMDLPDWVASIAKGERMQDVFDVELMKGRLPGDDDELIHALQVAMACVRLTPLERPDMGEVVQQLEQIKPDLKQ